MTHFRGGWILAGKGVKLWPQDPRCLQQVELDDLVDIFAQSLSCTTRYCGHFGFYSVAEHCSLMSLDVEEEKLKAWCMLHDTFETVGADVPYPLAQDSGMAFYRECEGNWLRGIADRFHLPWPIPLEVHRLDKQARTTERYCFEQRGRLNREDPPFDKDPLPSLQHPMAIVRFLNPEDAKRYYLAGCRAAEIYHR